MLWERAVKRVPLDYGGLKNFVSWQHDLPGIPFRAVGRFEIRRGWGTVIQVFLKEKAFASIPAKILDEGGDRFPPTPWFQQLCTFASWALSRILKSDDGSGAHWYLGKCSTFLKEKISIHFLRHLTTAALYSSSMSIIYIFVYFQLYTVSIYRHVIGIV